MTSRMSVLASTRPWSMSPLSTGVAFQVSRAAGSERRAGGAVSRKRFGSVLCDLGRSASWPVDLLMDATQWRRCWSKPLGWNDGEERVPGGAERTLQVPGNWRRSLSPLPTRVGAMCWHVTTTVCAVIEKRRCEFSVFVAAHKLVPGFWEPTKVSSFAGG